jgi:hypothetical protein
VQSLLSRVALIFFVYFLIQTSFVALTTQPAEGDSLYYHLPLAQHFLDGSFIRAEYGDKIHYYFPAASESLLAGFMALRIPLNLYNVMAIISLFISGYQLAVTYRLQKSSALLYGVSIALVTTVSRWALAQTVDIWLAVYFLQALRLLHQRLTSHHDYLLLGVWLGLLVGSKYSGLGFAAMLGVVYWQQWLRSLSFSKALVLGIPFLLLGGFWYIRNWVVVGSPFYPLPFLFVTGIEDLSFMSVTVGKAILQYPVSMFNAFLSEYMVWALLVVLLVVLLAFPSVRKYMAFPEWKLLFLGLLNLLVFLALPSGDSYQLHVSQFRFSYVVFMPLMLLIFILAEKSNYLKNLSIVAVANLFLLPSLAYYPKLLFLYVPLALIIFNWEQGLATLRQHQVQK